MMSAMVWSSTAIEKRSHGQVSGKLVWDIWLSFCPHFLYIFFDYFSLFLEISFPEYLCWIIRLGRISVIRSSIYLTLTMSMNTFFSTESRVFYCDRSLQEGKTATYLQWAQKWSHLTKYSQSLLFLSTLAATLWPYAVRYWKSRYFSELNLWIYRFNKEAVQSTRALAIEKILMVRSKTLWIEYFSYWA